MQGNMNVKYTELHPGKLYVYGLPFGKKFFLIYETD